MKNANKHVKSKLCLVPFFQSLSGRYKIHQYAHMFREDVALAIMPIGGTSRRHSNFSAQLTGQDSDQALALLKSISEDKARSLERTISAAIEKIVKELLWRGSSIYEIYGTDEALNIVHISPLRTFNLYWFTIQFVPKADQREIKRKFSLIKNSSTWRMSVPPILGGSRNYMRTIKILESVDSAGMPDFVRLGLGLGDRDSGFDFSHYDLLQTIRINKATKSWNWHRRDMSDNRQTEYCLVYKRTKFRLAQALLREHIIFEINNLFHLVGFDCELSVSGIPTSTDISLIIDKLEDKQISFSQTYESTSL